MSVSISNIEEIQRLLLAYAAGDYHVRADISALLDERDMILSGVNMLGEELQATTVSRDYFSGIYNAVSNMVLVLSLKGEIEDSNSAVLELLGYQKEKLKGQSIDILVNGENGSFFGSAKRRLGKEGASARWETQLVATDNKKIPVSCSFSRIVDKNDKLEGYLVVAEDITERKETEKLIVRTIVETQDNEQKRVANDLHDSLGQELSTVKLLLTAINIDGQSSDGKYVEAFETCKNLLDKSIENIRAICFNLMPASLEKGGIEAALEELVHKQGQHDLIGFTLKVPDKIPSLDKSLEIAIYRVTQEFISNSIKHAKASLISLHLFLDQGFVQFDIEDNGIGFEVAGKEHHGGRGLSTMSSRVKAFNGCFNLSSTVGKGTKLSIRFQIKREDGET